MDEQRVALVTAAGKGIGAAIARRLASDGYLLGLISNSGGAENLAAELGGVGLTGSVVEPDDLERLVTATMNEFGRIDAVVNNTGHPPKGPLLNIPDSDWHSGLDMVVLNVVRIDVPSDRACIIAGKRPMMLRRPRVRGFVLRTMFTSCSGRDSS